MERARAIIIKPVKRSLISLHMLLLTIAVAPAHADIECVGHLLKSDVESIKKDFLSRPSGVSPAEMLDHIATQMRQGNLSQVDKLEILNMIAKIKFLAISEESSYRKFFGQFPEFGIKSELSRYNLLLQLSQKQPQYLPDYFIRLFDIDSERGLVSLASRVVQRVKRFALNPKLLGFKDEAALVAAWSGAARNQPNYFVGKILRDDLTEFPSSFKESALKEDLPYLLEEFLKQLGARYFPESENGPNSIAEFKEMIKRTRGDLPSVAEKIFPDALIALIWDQVQDYQVGLSLLRSYHWIHLHHPEFEFESSLDLLAAISGLPSLKDIPPKKISTNRMRELYELLLDLHKGREVLRPIANVQLFEERSFDHQFFESRDGVNKLTEVLVRIRDLYRLRLDDQFVRSFRITLDRYEEIVASLERQIEGEFERLFADDKLKIRYADVRRLSEAWNGVEPALTLLARFHGEGENKTWKAEVPELARVFRASLENRFNAYKFEGDPEDHDDREQAKAQLAMLKSKAKRAAWQKPRAMLRSIYPSTESSPSGSVQKDLSQVPHQLQDLERHLAQIEGVDASGEAAILGAAFATSHAELKEKLLALESRLGPIGMRGVLQVLTDIAALLDLLTPKVPMKLYDGVVLSVVSAAPKLLLTAGDLVKTSSCQNYRTGGYIETLLGYVKDANVQVMASFFIRKDQFTPLQWAQVSSDLKTEAKTWMGVRYGTTSPRLRLEFNGDRRELTVHTSDGNSFVIEDLGDAYLRQMVKLGRGKIGGAGIKLEREYLQQHAALTVMKENHEALLKELRQDTGVRNILPITVVQSRNAGGVYSDSAGGIQKYDYTVE